MALFSNDARYCLLSSCKKLESFNGRFPRKCQKTQIFTLNTQIKFCFKIPTVSLFLLHWPATSCKLSEKTNEQSLRYLKTDRQTNGRTHRQTNGPQGQLLRTPTGKTGVQNVTHGILPLCTQYKTRQVYNGPRAVKFLSAVRKWFLFKKDFWTKKNQKMHTLCLIILATNTIFSDLMRNTLPKLHVKFQPNSLKIIWAKVEKL